MSLKKVALGLLVAAISSYAYADIIELDEYNPDHCRQQIIKSADILPVIATYTSDGSDGNSEAFMKKFEVLAKNHPERTFFKWDAKKDTLHVTQSVCLQQLGVFVQPNIILLAVLNEEGNEKATVSSPLRLQWSGIMSNTEMDKFIDVSDPSMKKSFLSQKNHY